MKWTIFYTDGSIFTDEDGGPNDAPAQGVQVICQGSREHNWVTVSQYDYYRWDVENKRWWGADQIGFILYLLKPGWKRVLFGEQTTEDQFREIFNRAYALCGEKNAFDPGERRP